MDIYKVVWEFAGPRLDISKYVGMSPKSTTSHDAGQKVHSVMNFEAILQREPKQLVVLRWGFCRDCAALRYKEIVGYDGATGNAYSRDLLNDRKVMPPTPNTPEVQQAERVFNTRAYEADFSMPGSDSQRGGEK